MLLSARMTPSSTGRLPATSGICGNQQQDTRDTAMGRVEWGDWHVLDNIWGSYLIDKIHFTLLEHIQPVIPMKITTKKHATSRKHLRKVSMWLWILQTYYIFRWPMPVFTNFFS